MKRKIVPIKYKKERVVFSDILPFEIPIIFSNRHFYNFLIKNNFVCNENSDKNKFEIKLNAIKPTTAKDEIIKLLLNCDNDVTIPFSFNVSHNQNDFRQLTIIHPRNQVIMVWFYEKYKDLILYYSKISPFSIRKPYKVAKYTFYNDKLHKKISDEDHAHYLFEQFDKEYESLKSFFAIKKYNNIHKFYESYQYHRCEKKFDKLFKFDISKCFDSIYTHSISWALISKEIVKDNIKSSKNTFSGKFDKIMQNLNYGETNGIVIGPEFSRIFAELILQKIDREVFEVLKKENLRHKKHYEIFRYVDDYFLFYDDEETKNRILNYFKIHLKEYKLYINDLKTQQYDKPIITEITIAKQRISDLFNKNLSFRELSKKAEDIPNDETETETSKEEKYYSLYVSSNQLITRFKTIIKETKIEYKEIQNYSLACLDRKIASLINKCVEIPKNEIHEEKIMNAFWQLIDFSFFIYSVSPRVNSTIKLCMLLYKIIMFTKKNDNIGMLNYNNKHLLFKKIFDEISFIMNKYKSSEFTQIETLYLLILLNELGREYRLNENVLGNYFHIQKTDKGNGYTFEEKYLNYFSIVTLLFYMKDISRFKNIKKALEEYIIKKFENVNKDHMQKNTELVLLLFDLISCPYIEKNTKNKLLTMYDIPNVNHNDIINEQKYWFTKWTKFDLGKELNAKKSKEVYG